ncbi:hypothetical protein, partial [Pseudomonas nitroreducens]|uniref:hypothetical protein n=1 Tax=Pseudomonas nitroreducens TaxID=46680 RepID=UPI0028ABAF70
ARDGPSWRAPETSVQRGYFSPQAKNRMEGQDLLVPFGAFAKRDSPEGAKQNLAAHTEATLKHIPTRRTQSA